MADLVQHAAGLRRVIDLDGLPDPAQPERTQRVELALVAAVARLALGDSDGSAHAGTSADSAAVSSTSPSLSSAPCSGWSVRPRDAVVERARSSAPSSGVRSDSSPAIVALTRLIGFWEPRLLERMSLIPASSSTARTPPPAMTPVPGEAGFKSTRPDPKIPSVS